MNSYESITQATPRPSSPLPDSSVRTTRPLHWILTFSVPPVTSGGSVISNSTGEPTSSEASARMYTPAARRFPVTPRASPSESSLWILIGSSSGNLFPVRASDTKPPLSWPCLCVKASFICHLLAEPNSPCLVVRLYHEAYPRQKPVNCLDKGRK